MVITSYLPHSKFRLYSLRKAMANTLCDYVSVEMVTCHGETIASISADCPHNPRLDCQYGYTALDAVIKAFREMVEHATNKLLTPSFFDYMITDAQ